MHPTSMNVRPRTCRAISSRYRSGTVGRRWRSRRSRAVLVAFIVVSTSLDVAERAELLEALGWNRCRGLGDGTVRPVVRHPGVEAAPEIGRHLRVRRGHVLGLFRVGGDDEDRAVGDAEVAETVAQPPDLAVDVRHLARVLREREADVAHARQPAGEVRLERQALQEEAAQATETRSELLAVAVALEVDGVEDERPNVPGGDAELVLERSHLG